VERVDKTVEVELRRGGELLREPAKSGRLDELVREQDALDAERPVHARLARGRSGDSPRAGIQLPA
jgi:hypothetical protein